MLENIPNLCTAINLLLGVTALAAIQNANPKLSAVLIVLAALLDRVDGLLARRLNVETQFGKEFDSLADLVSFGVAPSALAYSVIVKSLPEIGLLCFVVFTLCGAFRLARFNISSHPSYFLGVPITAAGAILAVAAALVGIPVVVATMAVLLSAAMVCTVRIPKI
ncbi:MAG: CDP-diacylglycerol--serine O-phosphatidyltransferase [Eubacteriales bacterium]